MKIFYIILGGFIFILLLFSVTTYINFRQSEKLDVNNAYITSSTEMIRSSNRLQRNMLNMVAGLRGYLLTGETYFSESYNSAAIDNQQILKQLFVKVPDTSQQYKQLIEINAINNRWINQYANPLLMQKKNAITSPNKDREFTDFYNKKLPDKDERLLLADLQENIRIFVNDEYKNRSERQVQLIASAQKTKVLSLFLTIFSALVGFCVAVWLAIALSKRILKMVAITDSIAAGIYTDTAPETKTDEFSKLQRSLNRMAAILAKNIALLKSRNEELDQFAHIVSHDLKSPLRGISNVVSWIEEDHANELTPKLKEYLEMIKGRTTKGELLIQGLLMYARVGKQVQLKEMLDLGKLVEEILQTIDVQPGQRIEVAPDMPIIQTEKLPLVIILSNLITNALKHNHSANPVVKIFSADMKNHYKIYVEDNGIGIDQKHHEKIFLIFQTLRDRESFDHTGVGLSIVKKILNNNNEKIFLKSEPGKGSTFSFTWRK